MFWFHSVPAPNGGKPVAMIVTNILRVNLEICEELAHTIRSNVVLFALCLFNVDFCEMELFEEKLEQFK
jgi:hypothetical protein